MNLSSRTRAWLAAGAIFTCGILVGGTGATWIGIRVVRRALHAPVDRPGAADRAAARIGAELSRSLALTPEESARVQQILDASAEHMKSIRASAVAEAGAELRRSTQQIAATLPPAKHAAFYRIIGRRFERLGLPPPRPE